tara:strand:+ start:248 stop:1321 length:1074 start_codon:yes stop_codon:yes gene_type:complete
MVNGKDLVTQTGEFIRSETGELVELIKDSPLVYDITFEQLEAYGIVPVNPENMNSSTAGFMQIVPLLKKFTGTFLVDTNVITGLDEFITDTYGARTYSGLDLTRLEGKKAQAVMEEELAYHPRAMVLPESLQQFRDYVGILRGREKFWDAKLPSPRGRKPGRESKHKVNPHKRDRFREIVCIEKEKAKELARHVYHVGEYDQRFNVLYDVVVATSTIVNREIMSDTTPNARKETIGHERIPHVAERLAASALYNALVVDEPTQVVSRSSKLLKLLSYSTRFLTTEGFPYAAQVMSDFQRSPLHLFYFVPEENGWMAGVSTPRYKDLAKRHDVLDEISEAMEMDLVDKIRTFTELMYK